jgi:hypothetical protein
LINRTQELEHLHKSWIAKLMLWLNSFNTFNVKAQTKKE